MNKNLIVIPTYNEKGNIDLLLSSIFKNTPDVSILFVDDNSQDGTADEIKAWQLKKSEQIHLLQREGKLGLGSAYLAGFAFALDAGFEKVVEMDADLSHDPSYLPKMFETLSGCDVSIGSRYIESGGTENWGLIRKFISRFGSFYARNILGMKVRDLTGGFNGWDASVLKTINLSTIKSEGYSFQIELKYRAHRHGSRIKEFPIIFKDRNVGQSKMSARILIEAIFRVWQIRFYKP